MIVIGNRYGSWIVLEKGSRKGDQSYKWVCKCELCGDIKEVRGDHLKAGYSRNCGCKNRKRFGDNFGGYGKKHGMKGHSLYGVWLSMKQRCRDENTIGYKLYGGRGITVCDLWENSFLDFYEWAINSGWKDGLTLDRYPNKDGGYEPKNCRWATPKQQANNKRNNILVLYNGEQMTLKQAVELSGNIRYELVRSRMKYSGYSFEEAMRPDKHRNKSNPRKRTA